jgi:DNA-binding transcriptional LysR family regulator
MLYEQLRTFRWTARLASMTAAGRRLHLTQAAVTHQVAQLEERFGARLFDRHARGVTLTPAGRRVLAHAEGILAKVDDLESELASLTAQPTPRVALAAHRGIVRYRLPGIVARYAEAHRGARFSLFCSVDDREILGRVQGGEVDVGITTTWTEAPAFRTLPLLRGEMFLCVAEGHRFARKGRTADDVDLADIGAEPLILYEPASAIRQRVDRVFGSAGLAPTVVLETGGAQILKAYTRRGLGASILSALALEQDRAGLYVIPVTRHFGELGYQLVLRKDKYVTRLLGDFVAMVEQSVTPLGGAEAGP